jgi:hypothetical protein
MASMIENLTGLLGRGFLLAGVLPVFVGVSTIGIVFILAFGIEALLALGLLRSPGALIVITVISVLLLLLLSIVLRAMRGKILSFFRGDSVFLRQTGIVDILTKRQSDRLLRLLRSMRRTSTWSKYADALTARINAAKRLSGSETARTPDQRIQRLLVSAERVADAAISGLPLEQAQIDALAAELVSCYGVYPNSDADNIADRLIAAMDAMKTRDVVPEIASARATWKKEFGPPGLVEPTRLGNLLLALDAYPLERYSMDGSLFWPHLETMAEDSAKEELRERRVQLEMVLAFAVVFLALTPLVAIGAPWVGVSVWRWLPITLVLVGLDIVFYLSVLQTAEALCNASRAMCDLTRHRLLRELGCSLPANLVEERKIWDELTQLLAYGEGELTFSKPYDT